MIPQVFNGMIAIMLAKFALNDVPHYLFSETTQTTHRTIRVIPPFKPHKHPAEPVARVVIVPGGSRWWCAKCGRVLEAGSEAVKVGGKVYCAECARGGNPGTTEVSTFYHATCWSLWEDIRRHGLIPSGIRAGGIYLWDTKEEAKAWVVDEMVGMPVQHSDEWAFVLLKVTVRSPVSLLSDPAWPSGAHITTGVVQPSDVKLLDVYEMYPGAAAEFSRTGRYTTEGKYNPGWRGGVQR